LDVLPGQPLIVDLPALDMTGDAITRTVEAEMTHAALENDGPSWLLRSDGAAHGTDAFRFRVDDGLGQTEPVTVTVRYCTTPTIVIEPTDRGVCPGDRVQFAVVAEGDNLVYRWRKNGYPIPGATSSAYTIERAERRHEGLYSVEVTRLCGAVSQTVDSGAANLSLIEDERCRKRIWLPFAANSSPP
jgi:hypothetical protein